MPPKVDIGSTQPRRVRIWLLLGLLATVPAPAQAEVGYGAGYAVFTARSDGEANIGVVWHYGGPALGVVYVYDAHTREYLAGNHAYSNSRDVSLGARVDGTRAAFTLVEPLTPGAWDSGTFAPPSEYLIVVLLFGSVSDWSPSPSSIPMELVSSGPVRVVGQHEMSGPASVEANALGPSMYASAGSTLSFDIEHQLLGVFLDGPGLPFSVGTPTGTLSGPEGDLTCPCSVRALTGPAARGPGTYGLSWTGAAASYVHSPFIGWADIEIP